MSKKEITEETLSEQKNLPDFSINSSVIKTVDDSSAQTKQPTARADGKFPQISIDSNNFDFGEVYEGENIIHSFKVKNTGSSVLTIKNVKPG